MGSPFVVLLEPVCLWRLPPSTLETTKKLCISHTQNIQALYYAHDREIFGSYSDNTSTASDFTNQPQSLDSEIACSRYYYRVRGFPKNETNTRGTLLAQFYRNIATVRQFSDENLELQRSYEVEAPFRDVPSYHDEKVTSLGVTGIQ